jgi:hypothetical protein
MMFNDQITDITQKPEIVPPSKWHIFFYLKYKFIVLPKIKKQLAVNMALIVDDINRPSVISRRITAKEPKHLQNNGIGK